MPIEMEEMYSENPGAASATASLVGPSVGQVSDEDIAQAEAAQADEVGPVDVEAFDSVDATAASGTAGTGLAGASGSTGYDAVVGDITPEMTSAGQLANITSQASPLMTQAANRGARISNSRGLMNSSIAAGTAQAEMVKAATPFAQQDASTYFSNFLEDKKAQNTALGFSANAANVSALSNAELETQISATNAQLESQMSELNAQLETAVSQGNQQEANRIRLQTQELQTNAAIAIAEMNSRIAAENASLTTQVSLQNTAEWNDVMLQNAGIGSEIARQNADRLSQLDMFNAEQQNDIIQDVLAQNTELNKQFMVGEQQLDFVELGKKYDLLITRNESAAKLYQSHLQAVADIMAVKGLTAAKVTSAVNALQISLDNGLNLIDQLNQGVIGGLEAPETPAFELTPEQQAAIDAAIADNLDNNDGTAIADPNPTPIGAIAGIPPYGTPEWDEWVGDIDIGGI